MGLALAASVVFGISAAQTATFTVCASGCDYTSIQAAVTAASSGDTISIASGTYAESVLIDKPLTIVGVGATKPVITGLAPANYIVKVDAANSVTLDNLAIDGGGAAEGANAFASGIMVNDSGTSASPVEIKNSAVKDIWNVSAIGIFVTGTSSYVDVHDNTISSFDKHGMRFVKSSGKVHGNEIIGDNVDGTSRVQNLITLWGGSNIEIYSNILHNALTAPGMVPTWDSVAVLVTGYNADGSAIASQANVHDNEIYASDSGIVVGSFYTGGSTDGSDASEVVITANRLHDLNWGVNFEQSSASATINGNSFVSIGAVAVNSQISNPGTPPPDLVTPPLGGPGPGSGTVTIGSNWWGQITGPQPGQVASSVATVPDPWCTDGTCSTLSNNANLTALSLSSGTLSPAFSPSTTAYSASVDNGTTSITVTKTTNPGANAVVTGGSNLSVGNNTITVTVTSADEAVIKTYMVTVSRAAPVVDRCPNLGGVQVDMPMGFELVNGQCVLKPNVPVSAPAVPDKPGAVTVVVQPPTGTGTTPPPVTVTTKWDPGTFTVPVTVLVTPQVPVPVPGGTTPLPPAPVAGGFTVGSTTVQLTVTDASGTRVTSFQAPIVIHVSASQAGDVPAYSQDGVIWVIIPRLSSPELPAGQQDGYYRNSDGSIDIYTRHATLFGLLKDTQVPTAPKLKIRVEKTGLRLSWSNTHDNIKIAGYVVSRNGHGYKASRQPHDVVLPLKAGTYTVRARDASGNVSKPSAAVKVVRRGNSFAVAKD